MALYLCFSTVVPSLGGFLGSRGVGEGAEAEEPAVSKGGRLTVYYPVLQIKPLSKSLVAGGCGGVHSEFAELLREDKTFIHPEGHCCAAVAIKSGKNANIKSANIKIMSCRHPYLLKGRRGGLAPENF